MEENPRKGGTQEASRNGPTGRKHRYTDEDDESAGYRIKCSGKSCRSCTAGIIADCVAVCCCPCAVVNLLTLAFVKVPYMMGRKCLGKRKKKKKREMVLEREREGIFWREKEMGVEIGIGEELGLEKEENNYSARFEAEKVWLELYQVGHLGFGRVSFTGIQSLDKAN